MPIINQMRVHLDERGVLVSWLVKIMLGLAVAGVIAFDLGSILVNYFTLDSAANDTAIALSLGFEHADPFGTADHDVFMRAKEIIESGDSGASDAKVIRNGTNLDDQGFIHVELKRVAKTLVAKYIPPLRKYTRARVSGHAATN